MTPWHRLGRFVRTVRWLRPEQVIGRIRFRLLRPRPDVAAAPALRPAPGAWAMPARRMPSLIAPTRWHLLAQAGELDDIGWDDPTLPLLWRYNQHYFDDLNAHSADARRSWHRALVDRWIDANPPGRGTGWAPYPVSLRIVNWVKWFRGGEPPDAAWLHSLAVQTRWLAQRVEWHLLGNHLFVNAKALVFAGLFFEGSEADNWRAAGLAILAREIPEQILADGGHFERSPMYHALALEDVLDLLNLFAACGGDDAGSRACESMLRERAGRMLLWLRCMTHPDGDLARFNDCAPGIAPDNAEIERYAAVLGVTAALPADDTVTALVPSGYVRAARGGALALIDVAPVGPDYLPGHAHADTLSFELSVHGHGLIVNRGTSEYGTGARRQLERGTAAHSTVQVGGHDSSEVWAGFRVGRRARPAPLRIEGWRIEGSHDGYAHLGGRPEHLRRWRMDADALTVEDRLSPTPTEPAVARFHLAPGCRAQSDDGARWTVRTNDGTSVVAEVDGAHARVEPWQHATAFGTLVPAQTLVVELRDGAAKVTWRWHTRPH